MILLNACGSRTLFLPNRGFWALRVGWISALHALIGIAEMRPASPIHTFLIYALTSTCGLCIPGTVTTLAGGAGGTIPGAADGFGTTAQFNGPSGVSLSGDGSIAVIADYYSSIVRLVDVSSGAVTTVAGTAYTTGQRNGPGFDATFSSPFGVAMSESGTVVLIADQSNRQVRFINMTTEVVSLLAGSTASGSANGIGSAASFVSPTGVAVDASGSVAVVADAGSHTIRLINVSSSAVTTLAGNAGASGSADGLRSTAMFNAPSGIAMNAPGTLAVVADRQNNVVRKIVMPSGLVTTLAGRPGVFGSADGKGTIASFNQLYGVALNSAGAVAIVVDTYNGLVRLIDVPTGVVSTVAGAVHITGHADGTGSAATFQDPWGVAVNAAGTFALVVRLNALIVLALFEL